MGTNPGRNTATCLHDFAVEELGYDPDSVTKKVKQRIYRAGRDVLTHNAPGVRAKARKRRLGTQGRPTSATLESALLDWWADYREAVSSRLDTKSMVRAALVIRTRILDICRRKEIETPTLPQLTQA